MRTRMYGKRGSGQKHGRVWKQPSFNHNRHHQKWQHFNNYPKPPSQIDLTQVKIKSLAEIKEEKRRKALLLENHRQEGQVPQSSGAIQEGATRETAHGRDTPSVLFKKPASLPSPTTAATSVVPPASGDVPWPERRCPETMGVFFSRQQRSDSAAPSWRTQAAATYNTVPHTSSHEPPPDWLPSQDHGESPIPEGKDQYSPAYYNSDTESCEAHLQDKDMQDDTEHNVQSEEMQRTESCELHCQDDESPNQEINEAYGQNEEGQGTHSFPMQYQNDELQEPGSDHDEAHQQNDEMQDIKPCESNRRDEISGDPGSSEVTANRTMIADTEQTLRSDSDSLPAENTYKESIPMKTLLESNLNIFASIGSSKLSKGFASSEQRQPPKCQTSSPLKISLSSSGARSIKIVKESVKQEEVPISPPRRVERNQTVTFKINVPNDFHKPCAVSENKPQPLKSLSLIRRSKSKGKSPVKSAEGTGEPPDDGSSAEATDEPNLGDGPGRLRNTGSQAHAETVLPSVGHGDARKVVMHTTPPAGPSVYPNSVKPDGNIPKQQPCFQTRSRQTKSIDGVSGVGETSKRTLSASKNLPSKEPSFERGRHKVIGSVTGKLKSPIRKGKTTCSRKGKKSIKKLSPDHRKKVISEVETGKRLLKTPDEKRKKEKSCSGTRNSELLSQKTNDKTSSLDYGSDAYRRRCIHNQTAYVPCEQKDKHAEMKPQKSTQEHCTPSSELNISKEKADVPSMQKDHTSAMKIQKSTQEHCTTTSKVNISKQRADIPSLQKDKSTTKKIQKSTEGHCANEGIPKQTTDIPSIQKDNTIEKLTRQRCVSPSKEELQSYSLQNSEDLSGVSQSTRMDTPKRRRSCYCAKTCAISTLNLSEEKCKSSQKEPHKLKLKTLSLTSLGDVPLSKERQAKVGKNSTESSSFRVPLEPPTLGTKEGSLGDSTVVLAGGSSSKRGLVFSTPPRSAMNSRPPLWSGHPRNDMSSFDKDGMALTSTPKVLQDTQLVSAEDELLKDDYDSIMSEIDSALKALNSVLKEKDDVTPRTENVNFVPFESSVEEEESVEKHMEEHDISTVTDEDFSEDVETDVPMDKEENNVSKEASVDSSEDKPQVEKNNCSEMTPAYSSEEVDGEQIVEESNCTKTTQIDSEGDTSYDPTMEKNVFAKTTPVDTSVDNDGGLSVEGNDFPKSTSVDSEMDAISDHPTMDESYQATMDESNFPKMTPVYSSDDVECEQSVEENDFPKSTSVDSKVDASDQPSMDESYQPTMDESDPPTMDESDQPTMDESDQPTMDESDQPTMDESNFPKKTPVYFSEDEEGEQNAEEYDFPKTTSVDSKVDASDQPNEEKDDISNVTPVNSSVDVSEVECELGEEENDFPKTTPIHSEIDASDQPNEDKDDTSNLTPVNSSLELSELQSAFSKPTQVFSSAGVGGEPNGKENDISKATSSILTSVDEGGDTTIEYDDHSKATPFSFSPVKGADAEMLKMEFEARCRIVKVCVEKLNDKMIKDSATVLLNHGQFAESKSPESLPRRRGRGRPRGSTKVNVKTEGGEGKMSADAHEPPQQTSANIIRAKTKPTATFMNTSMVEEIVDGFRTGAEAPQRRTPAARFSKRIADHRNSESEACEQVSTGRQRLDVNVILLEGSDVPWVRIERIWDGFTSSEDNFSACDDGHDSDLYMIEQEGAVDASNEGTDVEMQNSEYFQEKMNLSSAEHEDDGLVNRLNSNTTIGRQAQNFEGSQEKMPSPSCNDGAVALLRPTERNAAFLDAQLSSCLTERIPLAGQWSISYKNIQEDDSAEKMRTPGRPALRKGANNSGRYIGYSGTPKRLFQEILGLPQQIEEVPKNVSLVEIMDNTSVVFTENQSLQQGEVPMFRRTPAQPASHYRRKRKIISTAASDRAAARGSSQLVQQLKNQSCEDGPSGSEFPSESFSAASVTPSPARTVSFSTPAYSTRTENNGNSTSEGEDSGNRTSEAESTGNRTSGVEEKSASSDISVCSPISISYKEFIAMEQASAPTCIKRKISRPRKGRVKQARGSVASPGDIPLQHLSMLSSGDEESHLTFSASFPSKSRQPQKASKNSQKRSDHRHRKTLLSPVQPHSKRKHTNSEAKESRDAVPHKKKKTIKVQADEPSGSGGKYIDGLEGTGSNLQNKGPSPREKCKVSKGKRVRSNGDLVAGYFRKLQLARETLLNHQVPCLILHKLTQQEVESAMRGGGSVPKMPPVDPPKSTCSTACHQTAPISEGPSLKKHFSAKAFYKKSERKQIRRADPGVSEGTLLEKLKITNKGHQVCSSENSREKTAAEKSNCVIVCKTEKSKHVSTKHHHRDHAGRSRASSGDNTVCDKKTNSEHASRSRSREKHDKSKRTHSWETGKGPVDSKPKQSTEKIPHIRIKRGEKGKDNRSSYGIVKAKHEDQKESVVRISQRESTGKVNHTDSKPCEKESAVDISRRRDAEKAKEADGKTCTKGSVIHVTTGEDKGKAKQAETKLCEKVSAVCTVGSPVESVKTERVRTSGGSSRHHTYSQMPGSGEKRNAIKIKRIKGSRSSSVEGLSAMADHDRRMRSWKIPRKKEKGGPALFGPDPTEKISLKVRKQGLEGGSTKTHPAGSMQHKSTDLVHQRKTVMKTMSSHKVLSSKSGTQSTPSSCTSTQATTRDKSSEYVSSTPAHSSTMGTPRPSPQPGSTDTSVCSSLYRRDAEPRNLLSGCASSIPKAYMNLSGALDNATEMIGYPLGIPQEFISVSQSLLSFQSPVGPKDMCSATPRQFFPEATMSDQNSTSQRDVYPGTPRQFFPGETISDQNSTSLRDLCSRTPRQFLPEATMSKQNSLRQKDLCATPKHFFPEATMSEQNSLHQKDLCSATPRHFFPGTTAPESNMDTVAGDCNMLRPLPFPQPLMDVPNESETLPGTESPPSSKKPRLLCEGDVDLYNPQTPPNELVSVDPVEGSSQDAGTAELDEHRIPLDPSAESEIVSAVDRDLQGSSSEIFQPRWCPDSFTTPRLDEELEDLGNDQEALIKTLADLGNPTPKSLNKGKLFPDLEEEKRSFQLNYRDYLDDYNDALGNAREENFQPDYEDYQDQVDPQDLSPPPPQDQESSFEADFKELASPLSVAVPSDKEEAGQEQDAVERPCHTEDEEKEDGEMSLEEVQENNGRSSDSESAKTQDESQGDSGSLGDASCHGEKGDLGDKDWNVSHSGNEWENDDDVLSIHAEDDSFFEDFTASPPQNLRVGVVKPQASTRDENSNPGSRHTVGCDWTKDLHPGQESISGGYQDRQLPGPREPRSLLNEPPKPTRIVGDLRNLINSASSARSYSSLYPSSHSSSASYSLSYSSAPPSISATAYAGTSQSSVGRPLPLQRIRMQEERADGSRDTGESRNDLSRVQSIPGAPVAPSCAPNDPGKNPSLFRVPASLRNRVVIKKADPNVQIISQCKEGRISQAFQKYHTLRQDHSDFWPCPGVIKALLQSCNQFPDEDSPNRALSLLPDLNHYGMITKENCDELFRALGPYKKSYTTELLEIFELLTKHAIQPMYIWINTLLEAFQECCEWDRFWHVAETYREIKDYVFPVDVLNIALVGVVEDMSGNLETAVHVIDSLKVEQLRAINLTTLNRLLGMCELQEWSDGETIIKKAIRLVNVVHLVTEQLPEKRKLVSRSRLIADVQGCGQHWGRLAEVLCSICNQGMYLDGNAGIFSGAILGAANPSHAYSLFVDATLAIQPDDCVEEVKENMGSIARQLLTSTLKNRQTDCGYRLLYIMHEKGIHYYKGAAEQKAGGKFGVVLAAVAICVHANQPEGAIQVLEGTQWPHPQPQSQEEPQQRVFRLQVWYALVGQLLQRKQTAYALSVIKDIFSSQDEDKEVIGMYEEVIDVCSMLNQLLSTSLITLDMHSAIAAFEMSKNSRKPYQLDGHLCRALICYVSKEMLEKGKEIFLHCQHAYPLVYTPHTIQLNTAYSSVEVFFIIEVYMKKLLNHLRLTNRDDWSLYEVRLFPAEFPIRDVPGFTDEKILSRNSMSFFQRVLQALKNFRPPLQVDYSEDRSKSIKLACKSLHKYLKSQEQMRLSRVHPVRSRWSREQHAQGPQVQSLQPRAPHLLHSGNQHPPRVFPSAGPSVPPLMHLNNWAPRPSGMFPKSRDPPQHTDGPYSHTETRFSRGGIPRGPPPHPMMRRNPQDGGFFREPSHDGDHAVSRALPRLGKRQGCNSELTFGNSPMNNNPTRRVRKSLLLSREVRRKERHAHIVQPQKGTNQTKEARQQKVPNVQSNAYEDTSGQTGPQESQFGRPGTAGLLFGKRGPRTPPQDPQQEPSPDPYSHWPEDPRDEPPKHPPQRHKH